MGKFKRIQNGSVTKMKGNRRNPYRVRKLEGYNENGSQIYKTIGYYPTYNDAFEALLQYNHNPYDLSQRDLKVKDLLDLVYKEQEKVLKANSLRSFRTSRNHAKSLEDMYIKDVKTLQLQNIVDGIESSNSKSKLKTFFNLMFTYALKIELPVKNYAEFIEIRNGSETKKKKVNFSDKEIKEIYNRRGESPLVDIVNILLFSGMRPSEVIELKKENIDFENNIMIGGLKTISGIDRTIPISKHIKPILERYYETDKPYLFYNKRKNKYTYDNLSKTINKHFNHTAHECRHTMMSNFYRTSVDKLTVKKIVGHKSNNVTEDVYVHKTTEELLEAMKIFDDYMTDIL